MDGRGPFGPVPGEVGKGHGPAVGRGAGGDFFGQRAAVEIFPARLSDAKKGFGLVGRREPLARQGGSAAGKKDAGEFRQMGIDGDGRGPGRRRDRRDGKALPGVCDGRRQQGFEGKLAEPFRQAGPEVDGAGHGDRVPPDRRHFRQPLEPVRMPRRRRPARPVDAVKAGAVPDHGEGVAAQAVARGLDHRESRGRCDGRIHRVAALKQHPKTRLGRQRLRRGDSVFGHHRYPAGRIGETPLQAG